MANSSLNLTSLDHEELVERFKTYLSTQSVFKDYNFEGSNIKVLLDVMAYNTYLNSFYLNMVASEMFLDSAQKLDTVVSHAKELNYVPRSAASAVANVSFTANTNGITLPFTIPQGTIFSGTNSNGSFSFVTRIDTTYASPNTVFTVEDLQIYEGLYVNNSFIVDYRDERQRFVLNNENIDLDSLEVTVYENNLQTNGIYRKVETLFGLTETSNVYFVQACEKNQYEILFGDGVLGYKPQNESLIVAKYMVTNGSDADGITSFTINSDLAAYNGGEVTVTDLTTSSNSSGGANAELIESIRFYAPRYFATQYRAIASDDYDSIIMSRFGGSVADVNVYGGETLDPKQYGRVVVCIKPTTGEIAADFLKSEISNYMLDFISVPTRLIITDPDMFYIYVNTTVQYNKSLTTKSPTQIQNLVRTAISEYNTDNLGVFENDFRYSKFITAIDDADTSISSNSTEVKMIKRLAPRTNTPTSYSIDFGNAASNDYVSDLAVLDSTNFTYVDEEGTHYTLCKMKDLDGKVIVYKYINNVYTVLAEIGTINYTTGVVSLVRLHTSSYDNYISLYLKLQEKDIIASQSKILSIDLSDVTISIVESRV